MYKQAIWLQGSLLYLWHPTKASSADRVPGVHSVITQTVQLQNKWIAIVQRFDHESCQVQVFVPGEDLRGAIQTYYSNLLLPECSTSLPTFEAMILYHISSSSITVALEYNITHTHTYIQSSCSHLWVQGEITMLTCNRLQYCVGSSTFTHIDLFMCQAIIQHTIYIWYISNNYRLHGRWQMVNLSNNDGIQHEGRTTDSIIIHPYFQQTAHSFLSHEKGWRAACGFRCC